MTRSKETDKNKVIDINDYCKVLKLANASDNDYKRNYELRSRIFNLKGKDFMRILNKLNFEQKEELFFDYQEAIYILTEKFIDSRNRDKYLKPIEEVAFFSPEKESRFYNVDYLIDEAKQSIYINANNHEKGKLFVYAVLRRYFQSSIYEPDGSIIRILGVSKTKFDPEGLPVERKNEALQHALTGLLVSEIMRLATGKVDTSDPNILESLNLGKEEKMMKVANLLREAANKNENMNFYDEKYDSEKDALLYDLFINKQLFDTRRVIDARFGEGALDRILSYITNLAALEGEDFRIAYLRLVNRLYWMIDSK